MVSSPTQFNASVLADWLKVDAATILGEPVDLFRIVTVQVRT